MPLKPIFHLLQEVSRHQLLKDINMFKPCMLANLFVVNVTVMLSNKRSFLIYFVLFIMFNN